jgi:hypothetical protein
MIDVSRDLERMQDYVIGRLSDEELRAFEERLVRDPALARELDQSVQLREGLAELRQQGYFARASRSRIFQSWLPTLAAAAVAGIAIALLWSRSPEPVLMGSLQPVSASHAAPWVAAHFTFVSVRGASDPVLTLPASGLIELRAMPAAHEPDVRYRVRLVRQEGAGATSVGELVGLVPGEDGYVHSYADAARLKAGRYVLSVETAGGKGAETFPFTLKAAEPQRS